MTTHDVSHFPKILVINSTAKDQTAVALIDRGKASFCEQEKPAQDLQLMIKQLLDENSTKASEIKAVAILEGPGSYTGIRIGAAAANTIHWLYRLPVIVLPGTDIKQAVRQLIAGEQFAVTTNFSPRN